MILMTGNELSQNIKNELKQEVKGYMIKPCLAIIQIGNDSASTFYVQNKIKACSEVGIYLKHIQFSEDTKEIEIINKIVELNNDDYVNGIMLQLPVPEKYNYEKLINYIARNKDVDGLTDLSVGKLWNNKKSFIPCAPQAVLALADFYQISLEGKNVVIVNRSNLVGKPLITMLLQRNATVTICHSKTENLEEYLKKADIVITAVGQKNFISKDMIKKDVIVFDVGKTLEDGKCYGDVNIENLEDKASYVTPTPGGVGMVAVVMLLQNVVEAYRKMNIEK